MSVDVDQRMLNAITRLFDEMYRQGYMDSYSIQQDGSLYEFLDKVSTPDKFGILTDDHTMSWFEYKLYINSRVYKWHYRKEMEGILDEIKNMRKKPRVGLEAEQAPSRARKRCQEGTGSMRSRGGSLRQEVEGRNPKSYPR